MKRVCRLLPEEVSALLPNTLSFLFSLYPLYVPVLFISSVRTFYHSPLLKYLPLKTNSALTLVGDRYFSIKKGYPFFWQPLLFILPIPAF
ncbi:hypothetical protein BH24BAC1_BH24BAC1_33690 [soil metagenome]